MVARGDDVHPAALHAVQPVLLPVRVDRVRRHCGDALPLLRVRRPDVERQHHITHLHVGDAPPAAAGQHAMVTGQADAAGGIAVGVGLTGGFGEEGQLDVGGEGVGGVRGRRWRGGVRGGGWRWGWGRGRDGWWREWEGWEGGGEGRVVLMKGGGAREGVGLIEGDLEGRGEEAAEGTEAEGVKGEGVVALAAVRGGDTAGDGGLLGLVGEEKEGSVVMSGGEGTAGGGDGVLGGGNGSASDVGGREAEERDEGGEGSASVVGGGGASNGTGGEGVDVEGEGAADDAGSGGEAEGEGIWSEVGGGTVIGVGAAVGGMRSDGGDEEGGGGGGDAGFIGVSWEVSVVGGEVGADIEWVGASAISGEGDACVASEGVGCGSLIAAADGTGERQQRPSWETAPAPPSYRPSQTAVHQSHNTTVDGE